MADESDQEEIESEFILSLCWDRGSLAAVYYNLTTFELHVSLFTSINT